MSRYVDENGFPLDDDCEEEWELTDNEIIKALECCVDGDCRDCPYGGTRCEGFEENLLSLINRQKAEIEELNRELRRAERYLNQIADDWEDWDD